MILLVDLLMNVILPPAPHSLAPAIRRVLEGKALRHERTSRFLTIYVDGRQVS